ncbi:MAG: hypothetical protein QOH59_1197 [Gemmatimonadales bacterium]|nr:hypothetical protein [Gemmatimonadales bacterium]
MRRLALAAFSAALVLSACSDQNRESPTEPSATPEGNLLTRCQVTRFPALRVAELIVKVFPKGRLRVEAALRAGATALLWDTCKPALARKAAAGFLEFMNRNSGQLTGSQAQKDELIRLMFTGVGLASPGPIVLGPDFGIGTVEPNATTPTTIETQGSTALVQFEPAGPGQPAAFNETTVVSIFRHGDDFRLLGFPEEDQYPPFFDYSATNPSNNHVIAEGAVVRMAFCLLGSSSFPNGYPDAARIGHNPAANVPGLRFEIIPQDPSVGDFGDDLVCSNLETSLGEFGGGLRGFGRATGRVFGSLVRGLFLPQPLLAVAVGPRGPLGGLPPSLSNFGVVNATSYFGYEEAEPAWGATGLWDRQTLVGVLNTASPVFVTTVGNALPTPKHGNFAGWYGQPSRGNYMGTQATGDPPLSGGTSTAATSGVFLSPAFTVPDVTGTQVELRFKTWWEIEGVNPGGAEPFDVMSVEILHSGGTTVLKRLNPALDPTFPADRSTLPYTSAGFNLAPQWVDEAINISAYEGQSVRIRFVFNTRDVRYNGFRGWVVDDVRISSGTSTIPPPIGLRMQQIVGDKLVPADQLPSGVRP